MNDEAKSIKLKELLQNTKFLGEMEQTNSVEELKQVFNKNGLDLSIEEIKAFAKAMATMHKTDEEISESDLEAVAGGFGGFAGWVIMTAYSILKDTGKAAWNFGKKCANWF